MSDPVINEILDLNQQLLDAIALGDWATYEALCDPSITCFEPETRGHLVRGLDFHRYYFELGASEGPRNTTMASPKVRIIGDCAVIAYVRLVQSLDAGGVPQTSQFDETRIWRLEDGQWRHVHLHRSPCA